MFAFARSLGVPAAQDHFQRRLLLEIIWSLGCHEFEMQSIPGLVHGYNFHKAQQNQLFLELSERGLDFWFTNPLEIAALWALGEDPGRRSFNSCFPLGRLWALMLFLPLESVNTQVQSLPVSVEEKSRLCSVYIRSLDSGLLVFIFRQCVSGFTNIFFIFCQAFSTVGLNNLACYILRKGK